ncbi:hypothetical protein VTJ04DRAFT_3021 [Mycothermus thermophilus]|uniref:uncharacterized protein n=1 Tax=Humicola insolens TaxID=85995 RepID=UPI0037447F2D
MSRFHALTTRFSFTNLRKRSMSSSSTASTTSRTSSINSITSSGPMPIPRSAATVARGASPVSSMHSASNSIHSILLRRQSLLEEEQDEEERPLQILEPRPAMRFCSLEERLMAF